MGTDHLSGGDGNDSLFSVDTALDVVSGGAGFDSAVVNSFDRRSGIESETVN